MDCELLIVGSGILGTTAAYLARRHSKRRVLLIDRDAVASGATLYSAGLATTWGQTPLKRQMASRAAELYSEMASIVPGVRIEEQLIIWVVRESSVAKFASNWQGDPPEKLSGVTRGELLAHYSELRIPSGVSLYLDKRARWGAPATIATAVVEHLRSQAGFQVWEGVRVCSISANGPITEVHFEDGRCVRAKQAAFFPGPWVREEPWRSCIAKDEVRIKKIVALQVQCQIAAGAPVLYFFDDEAFLLPRPRERSLLLSITSNEWDCTPDRNRLSISRSELNEGNRILEEYFGERMPIGGGRVFCDAYTVDRTPFFHSVIGLGCAAIAGGCSGSGFRLAPAIAERTLQLLDEVAAIKSMAEG